MGILNIRTAILAIAAGVGLGGCAYGPYGGLGVGVGYGNGYYDPYYGGRYYSSGYGYPGYGYPGYGYGYGSPYYGWYDGFYYPGTGYYVYDRYRRPYRWTDAQRRYWERRQGVARPSGGTARILENWADFQNGPQVSSNTVRQRSFESNQTVRTRPVVHQQVQTERQQIRQERRAARAEARQESKTTRNRGNRRGTHND